MERAVEKPAKLMRMPPSDVLLANTFDRAKALRAADRPAYMAWLLGLCSLRRGEIAQMRWEWVVRMDGRCCIVVPASDAKSDAARMIPLEERVASELDEYRTLCQRGIDVEEEGFVWPSPRVGQGGPEPRLRAQNVFKRASAWLRSCGWETNHTLHEMRAVYLMWVRDGFGLDVAQAVAGHSSSKTTQESYVGRMSIKGVTLTLPLEIGDSKWLSEHHLAIG